MRRGENEEKEKKKRIKEKIKEVLQVQCDLELIQETAVLFEPCTVYLLFEAQRA